MLSERQAASTGPRSTKTPGSVAWCWQTLDAFRDSLRHVDSQFRQADEILDDLEQLKVWKVIPPAAPYGSLKKMLEAEVGFNYEQVRAKIKTAREKYAGTVPAAHNGVIGNGRSSSRGTRATQKSDTAESAVARLKRDAYSSKDVTKRAQAKALLDDVMDDKITPNAAARQMGWRSPRVVLTSPEQVARKLQEIWTTDQILQLVALLVGIGASDASD